MKKSAFISDILFSFAVTFLPALCLLRYLRLPLAASLLFAAVAGLLVSLAVWFFLDKKREKLCLKKQDEEAKEKLLLHLALSTQKQNAEYFAGYFSSKAKRRKKKNCTILISSNMLQKTVRSWVLFCSALSEW